MQEQLVTFETAKLAKEKGFNLPISSERHYFVSYGTSIQPYKWFPPEYFVDYIDAPTQSLLQKWLREEHKLEITLTYYSNESVKNWGDMIKGNYYIGVTDERDSDNPKWPFDGYFNSYEEALEIGLQEALKLI